MLMRPSCHGIYLILRFHSDIYASSVDYVLRTFFTGSGPKYYDRVEKKMRNIKSILYTETKTRRIVSEVVLNRCGYRRRYRARTSVSVTHAHRHCISVLSSPFSDQTRPGAVCRTAGRRRAEVYYYRAKVPATGERGRAERNEMGKKKKRRPQKSFWERNFGVISRHPALIVHPLMCRRYHTYTGKIYALSVYLLLFIGHRCAGCVGCRRSSVAAASLTYMTRVTPKTTRLIVDNARTVRMTLHFNGKLKPH